MDQRLNSSQDKLTDSPWQAMHTEMEAQLYFLAAMILMKQPITVSCLVESKSSTEFDIFEPSS